MITNATLTCPKCAHKQKEEMPETFSPESVSCDACGYLMKADEGQCCVYCQYSDMFCPVMQHRRNCCS